MQAMQAGQQATVQVPMVAVQALPPAFKAVLPAHGEPPSVKGLPANDVTLVPAWIAVAKDGGFNPFVVMGEPAKEKTEVTLMIRNVPSEYTPEELLEAIGDWRQFVDFFYMPIDFSNCSNLGYAFVNFHNVEAASAFRRDFDGLRLPLYQHSNKVLAVSEARVQGLHANIERFRNSSVMNKVTEDFKPMLFDKNGERVPFPKPDTEVPPAPGPRFRRQAPHISNRPKP